MDALAGYGSDSSAASSANSETPTPGDDQKQGRKKAVGHKEAVLSGLLAHYSDDDDADETVTTDGGATKNGGGGDGAMGGDGGGEGPPPLSSRKKRRRRRWDNPDAGGDQPPGPPTLPPPRLAGASSPPSDAFSALIEFGRDYTAALRTRRPPPASDAAAAQRALSEKLDRMRGVHSPSLAAHLRRQHEFGNPHTFPSVVSHCGIDPGGTNLDPSLWDPAEFREFEYSDRLVRAEEQSRIRAAEAANRERKGGVDVALHLKMAMGGGISGGGGAEIG